MTTTIDTATITELIADAFQRDGMILPTNRNHSLRDCVQDARDLNGRLYLYYNRAGEQTTRAIYAEVTCG